MELRPLCVFLLLMGLIHCTTTEKPKPELTSDLKGAALTGNSVTLYCTLKLQSDGWKFYWSNHTQSTETETETHSYTINPVSVSDGGQYRCRAGRGKPVYYTDYSDALWVDVIDSPKPVVIIKPGTQVYREEKVTLRCNIQGGGGTQWTYSWYKKDYTLYPYRTTQEFSFSSVRNDNSGEYTCIGRRSSDSQSSEISDAVTLTVSEKPKPELTSSREGAVLTGNSVTLYCTLKPQSDGWKFYWSNHTQSRQTETETHTYTISSVSVSDGGQYWCRAGRGKPVYYTDYSDALWVNVIESPKPVVIIKPDTQVFRGETVTFRCEIQGGDTEWTYDWYRDDNTFNPSITAQGIISSDYDSGKYTCRGRRRSDSQISKTSDPVTLTVSEKPKPQLTSSLKGAVLTGNSVTLYCTLKLQSDGWKFYWSKRRQRTETDTETYTYSRSVRVSDGGQYKCRAGRGNPVYYTDYSDELRVDVIVKPKPVVIIKPDTQVYREEKVTLRCNIQGGGGTQWTYSWYKNEIEYRHHTTQGFTISSVTDSDRGKYTCRRSNSSYYQISEISAPVRLTVSEKPKPQLTSDLIGAALTGNSVILSCTLKSQSNGWRFYWIKPTQSTETETETKTQYYFIRSVSVSDGGQYWCRAGRGNPVYYTDYSDALWVNVTGESPSVSLIINPSRTQHFTADSLSLSCEDQSDSTGWTVRGYTHSETLFECSSVSGSTCNISPLSTSHTGVYWCQSESGRRSNPVNITVHNGDVILESPVHPVTEGHPLTLHCLHHNSKISDSGVDFYKNDSVLQSQTTGEMTISTVSKSDEGFYHCKHPERGESPKSWISVRTSASGSSGVIMGLSLAFVFVILMILLILLLHFKKKKGVEYQTPSTVNQDTNQPADGDNIYENADIRTTDAVAGLSDVTYADIELKNQKKPKRKQGKSSEGADTVYSELKQNTDKDAAAGQSDMTYAKIELKNQKRPKRKQGKSSEGADTVHSELKQNTDKGP